MRKPVKKTKVKEGPDEAVLALRAVAAALSEVASAVASLKPPTPDLPEQPAEQPSSGL